MHTLIIVGGGFALLVAFLLLGYGWGDGNSGLVLATKIFIPIWFIASFINMWIGVRHGYSWGAELPIFFLIFLIPAVISSLIIWKVS